MWLSVDAFAERVVSGETVAKGNSSNRNVSYLDPTGGYHGSMVVYTLTDERNIYYYGLFYGVEVGKNLRGGSEIGPVNRVATIAGVDIRSGDESHESCFYIAVFDGPSLCKIIATDDDSTFLKVEFAPEDGPQLLVTAMNAEQVLSMSI